MTPIEEQVATLHRIYCEGSGREEPQRFYDRAWNDLLMSPEYRGDFDKLRLRVGFVAWYLKVQIGKDKRNPGALKLRNLLQPDQFAADFAEAKSEKAKAWQIHCAKHGAPEPEKPARPTTPAPVDEAVAKAGAASLREFVKTL